MLRMRRTDLEKQWPPPVVLTWKLQTRADIIKTWRLLSDTDRFNRVAGVNLRFTETVEDGQVKRVGYTDKLGMRLHWDEQPFVYEEPRYFKIERRFQDGPAEVMRVELRLSPCDSGTEISYEVQIVPRMAVLWPVLAADARLTVRPQLDTALKRAVQSLDHDAPFDIPPPPLSDEGASKLDDGLRHVQPAALQEGLRSMVRTAPPHQQARISPIAVARDWDIDEDEVLTGFLTAVRDGALSMTWELLCPQCQGPKATTDRFGAERTQVHCPSCNIIYDGSFPDSVNVSFKPHTAVRALDVDVECLLSPARTPHVRANVALEPEDSVTLTLELEEGGYLLQPEPSTGNASLEVREDLDVHEVTADLTADGMVPAVLRVGAGPVTVHLRSQVGHRAHVSVRKRWRPPNVLTAGRLLEVKGAAALLPPRALGPAIDPEVARHAVLVADQVRPHPSIRDKVRDVLDNHSPTLVYDANDVTIALFPRFEQALTVAAVLDDDPRCALGLGCGPVMVLDGVPSGRTIDRVPSRGAGCGGGSHGPGHSRQRSHRGPRRARRRADGGQGAAVRQLPPASGPGLAVPEGPRSSRAPRSLQPRRRDRSGGHGCGVRGAEPAWPGRGHQDAVA